ncbi:MAG: hypothetical protein U0736_08625 [Gemmataceae bacterium]
MATRRIKKPTSVPNTGSEEIPPGATTQAADREQTRGGGPAGSGGGSRHAANDIGTPDETYDASDTNQPLADDPANPDERADLGQGYGGSAGGAVGGTPAGKRASGGRTGGGLRPGSDHRGDTTIGSDPDRPTE